MNSQQTNVTIRSVFTQELMMLKSKKPNYNLKIAIHSVSGPGTGTGSLILRYTDEAFGKHSKGGGTDIPLKTLSIDGKNISGAFWKLNNQERTTGISFSYYKGAHALVLCAEATDKNLDTVYAQGIDQAKQYADKDVPICLFITKCDLINDKNRAQFNAEISRLALAHPDYPIFFTSAKTGKGVEEGFHFVLKKALGFKGLGFHAVQLPSSAINKELTPPANQGVVAKISQLFSSKNQPALSINKNNTNIKETNGEIKLMVSIRSYQGCAGATSIFNRYISRQFYPGSLATIGADMQRKDVIINDKPIKALIWDLPGNQRFNTNNSQILVKSDINMICFEIDQINGAGQNELVDYTANNTKPNSFIIICITKADHINAENQEKFESDVVKLKSAYPDYPIFLTSARSGKGVDEAFQFALKKALDIKLKQGLKKVVDESSQHDSIVAQPNQQLAINSTIVAEKPKAVDSPAQNDNAVDKPMPNNSQDLQLVYQNNNSNNNNNIQNNDAKTYAFPAKVNEQEIYHQIKNDYQSTDQVDFNYHITESNEMMANANESERVFTGTDIIRLFNNKSRFYRNKEVVAKEDNSGYCCLYFRTNSGALLPIKGIDAQLIGEEIFSDLAKERLKEITENKANKHKAIQAAGPVLLKEGDDADMTSLTWIASRAQEQGIDDTEMSSVIKNLVQKEMNKIPYQSEKDYKKLSDKICTEVGEKNNQLKKLCKDEATALEKLRFQKQSAVGLDLSRLEARISDLEKNQQALLDEYNQNQAELGEKQYILQRLQMARFYRTIQGKLQEMFLAYKVIGSGIIVHSALTTTDKVIEGISLAGDLIPLPLSSTVASWVKLSIETGVWLAQKNSEKNSSNIIAGLNDISVSFQELDALIERVARKLALMYDEQLQHITPTGASVLAEAAVKLMIAYLWVGDYEQVEIDQQLVSSVAKIHHDNAQDNFWGKLKSIVNARIDKFADNKIETNHGALWYAHAVFSRPGIEVRATPRNLYYSGEQTSVGTYGYRLGTEEESTKAGLTLSYKRADAAKQLPTSTQQYLKTLSQDMNNNKTKAELNDKKSHEIQNELNDLKERVSHIESSSSNRQTTYMMINQYNLSSSQNRGYRLPIDWSSLPANKYRAVNKLLDEYAENDMVKVERDDEDEIIAMILPNKLFADGLTAMIQSIVSGQQQSVKL